MEPEKKQNVEEYKVHLETERLIVQFELPVRFLHGDEAVSQRIEFTLESVVCIGLIAGICPFSCDARGRSNVLLEEVLDPLLVGNHRFDVPGISDLRQPSSLH